ncbi:thiol peroxidase [Campylobacter helveticus]|uniref:thiol peroxidase n=1 Tax=Campylobacter helveticus TaxID=28898 RepID=UPI0020962684|nr:thiol peroxidase [Campylobacter helveticus]
MKKKLILIPFLAFYLSSCKENASNDESIKEVDRNFTQKLISETKASLSANLNEGNIIADNETNTSLQSNALNDTQKIEKIKAFYEERLKPNFANAKVSFIKKVYLNGLEAFVFEFEVAGEKSKELVYVKGDLFFAEAIKFSDLKSLRDEGQELLAKDKFKDILEALKEDSAFIITLGSGDKELYVFSDPECPYCKKHLAKIDENFLKEHKVHFIFYSIHDNHKITASLYKELKDKKDDDEKLKIIKHYFFENPSYENISEEETKKTNKLFEKYKDLGVIYTPFEIETKN